MSDKKEKIVAAALQLFANQGYNATSTSKIAKAAGVSEGLIFRHFENKKGLLDAIYTQLEQRLQAVMAGMLFEEDAKEVIRKFIAVPAQIQKTDYNFWRLQYILKWQPEYHKPDKMKPVQERLEEAFTELGYKQPEMEAKHLMMVIDQIGKNILLDNMDDLEGYLKFLEGKYDL